MHMNTLFAGMLGGWEIILILAVVLILFGAKKLPELAKGLGQGIKEFKKATNEVTSEINSAMDDNRYSNPKHIEPPSQTKPAENEQATPSNKV
jgi:sec-independent protein translocase protein TatA